MHATASIWYQVAEDAVLILASLISLPLSIFILFLSYAIQLLFTTQYAQRRRNLRSPGFKQRTILITGVGSIKGLFLAQTFHLAGHNVIGTDYEPHHVPRNARFSRSLKKFYGLPRYDVVQNRAYSFHALLGIVHQEKVDLWISCSGPASASHDGQAQEILSRRCHCTCIQFPASLTDILNSQDQFMQLARELGLPVLETHNVTSRDAVHKVLGHSPRTKKRYVMKPPDVGALEMNNASNGAMTILPRRTLSETYGHISRIAISDTNPWILEQYIGKGRKYYTHSLIVCGEVKIFVSGPFDEGSTQYEALPSFSPLNQAMLRFTQEFARRMEVRGVGITGHLSFDFMVEDMVRETGTETRLTATNCQPRARTSAVLLGETKSKDIAEAYLSALDSPYSAGKSENRDMDRETNGSVTAPAPGYTIQEPASIDDEPTVLTPNHSAHAYSLPSSLLTLLILPSLHHLLRLLHLPQPQKPHQPSPNPAPDTLTHNFRRFLFNLFFGTEASFALWDPLPWWWANAVYWPLMYSLRVAGLLLGDARVWWVR